MKFLNQPGIQLALLTAVFSGFANFVNKFAVEAIKPPLVFTATKNIGVGLILIAVLLLARKWQLVKKLTRNQIWQLLAIAVIGGTIPFYLFFTGLAQIPAINAAIIHKTLVFWVVLMAVPWLKEKLSALQVVAVLLLFAGNVFVGGFKGFTFSTGEFMVLIATLFWAVENVIAKKVLKSLDPDIVTGARMGLGSVILVIAAAIAHPQALANTVNLSAVQWMWMTVSAATLLGYVMTWYRALKYAPAVTVTSVLVSATLITNVLSAIFVTHTWNLEMGIQAVLILSGAGLFISQAHKSEARSESLETDQNTV